ncbi:MAG: helix-turn-helix domain-containing protein [Acidimicrobiales bacterium]
MTDTVTQGGDVPGRRGRPAHTSTDDTVAAMLSSARRLFAAHGYTATSNRAVAADAGLAHTAIYNHFGSKARMFSAVFIDVQDLLIAELGRSVREEPTEPPLPGALFGAIEGLHAADPSYVGFLASMYVEVRRHPELRETFQRGSPFPIVDVLRDLAIRSQPSTAGSTGEEPMWFWIAFALGLAQISALADPESFATTLAALRRQAAGAAPMFLTTDGSPSGFT